MLKPSITELLEMTGSRYSLVIAASKEQDKSSTDQNR